MEKKRKQTNERILSIDICRAVAYQNARNCAGASFEEFCIIKRYSIYSLTSIPFAAFILCVSPQHSPWYKLSSQSLYGGRLSVAHLWPWPWISPFQLYQEVGLHYFPLCNRIPSSLIVFGFLFFSCLCLCAWPAAPATAEPNISIMNMPECVCVCVVKRTHKADRR